MMIIQFPINRRLIHSLRNPSSSIFFFHKRPIGTATSTSYLQSLYESWKKDPSSLSPSWQSYFAQSEIEVASPQHQQESSSRSIRHSDDISLLIRAYQVRGHHRANLDPLGILRPDLDFHPAPELDLEFYPNLHPNQSFHLGEFLPAFTPRIQTAAQILKLLQSIYCSTIGIEYMHIPSRIQCDWLRSQFEIPNRMAFNKGRQLQIFQWLSQAHNLESFLHTRFPGEKRFGLEGCESIIPGLQAAILQAFSMGTHSVVLGMPHRGRINVLANVMGKGLESILSEFDGDVDWSVEGSGDVKYHLGLNCERTLHPESDTKLHLSLVANPSHLEAVNPVVLGKTRALQEEAETNTKEKKNGKNSILPILIHGDASFSGQGVVYESLGFGALPNYTVGGTVHLVINNQIGFTTDPRFSRSTPYCTDIAKVVSAPILHVNADDVEAVVFCMEMAVRWRKTFGTDVVVDVVGYRRHGHNEFDEPSFTQPRMYRAIAQKKPVLELYRQQLLDSGVHEVDELQNIQSKDSQMLQEAFRKSKSYTPTTKEWLTSSWNGFMSPSEASKRSLREFPTGITQQVLDEIANAICTIPEGFRPHKALERVIEARKVQIHQEGSIDMATAEALAFGSLCLEGFPVRLSGQDVERGTFSQRHAVIHHQFQGTGDQERQYIPLANIAPGKQASFQVCNSSLSEFGVLGFEYGYSLASPFRLTVWEAQFGDFANNAQCIIDQFIVSGERKWIQRTGLVLLLPHGYDGAGPEHSNAHIERFLSLCDDEVNAQPLENGKNPLQNCNLQVAQPTTPANYFHLLRRQIHREFRKPLVILTSKSLLRHPMAKSNIKELMNESKFEAFLPSDDHESSNSSEKMNSNSVDAAVSKAVPTTRILLCAGQVYWAIKKRMQEMNLQGKGIAVARIEQISPFPYDELRKEIARFSASLKEIIWVQEEAMNVGAFHYVKPRIEHCIPEESPVKVGYAGRKPYAGIATGFKKQHIAEENEFLQQALKL